MAAHTFRARQAHGPLVAELVDTTDVLSEKMSGYENVLLASTTYGFSPGTWTTRQARGPLPFDGMVDTSDFEHGKKMNTFEREMPERSGHARNTGHERQIGGWDGARDRLRVLPGGTGASASPYAPFASSETA